MSCVTAIESHDASVLLLGRSNSPNVEVEAHIGGKKRGICSTVLRSSEVHIFPVVKICNENERFLEATVSRNLGQEAGRLSSGEL
jgi:hypothetical protein